MRLRTARPRLSRRIAQLTWIVVLLGVGHRLALFAWYQDDLRVLLDAGAAGPAWQYPTREALDHRLAATLWYWQQNPPLPVALLGTAGKLFGWPRGTAHFAILLQQALSILSAALLLRLLARATGRPLLAAAVALLFLVSVDLVTMEYNAFGQTFYEPLAMVLLLAIALAFARLRRTGRLRDTVWVGVLTGLLALTRAPFAGYACVVATLLLGAGLSGAGRHLSVFLAVAATLPGLWAAKNAAVFGAWRPSGSCWTGSHLAHGLAGAGFERKFRRFTASELPRYPAWFAGWVRRHGVNPWLPERGQPGRLFPPELRRRDAQLQAALGGANRPRNSAAQCALSEQFQAAWLRFARVHPARVLEKLRRSYVQFWAPIRNYPSFYVSLLYVKPAVESALRPAQLARTVRAGGVPEPERVMQSRFDSRPRRWRATWIPAASLAPLLFLCFEAFSLHLLTPAVLVLAAARRWRGASQRKPEGRAASRRRAECLGPGAEYALALGTVCYAALAFNLAEHGENMRFRLTVEPLVALLAVWNPLLLARLLRPARSRARS